MQRFHETLCATRVLDTACGTGNFLYVSLELIKRLEGEVLDALLDLGGQEALTGLEGHTVDPHQFLGLKLNPRAAAIAELVLWIGYLQRHFRTNGAAPGDPVLRKFDNINFGRAGGYDAVLTWDGWPVTKVVDGKESYPNARRPEWPDAEFIVGNPPFVGTRKLKERQGDGCVTALRDAYTDVARTADYVMYWYHAAAKSVSDFKTRRMGLITTKSIVRLVLETFISGDEPSCQLIHAITNHLWVDPEKGAAVRVAMTVLAPRADKTGARIGTVQNPGVDDAISEQSIFEISATLRAIPDVFLAQNLISIEAICFQGVVPANDGFKSVGGPLLLGQLNRKSHGRTLLGTISTMCR